MPISDEWPEAAAVLRELWPTFKPYAIGDLIVPRGLAALRRALLVADVLIIRAPGEPAAAYRTLCLSSSDSLVDLWHPEEVLWDMHGPLLTVLECMWHLSDGNGELGVKPYATPDTCRLPPEELFKLDPGDLS